MEMKNEFEVRGEITAIFLKKRTGEIFETIIDTEDLPKIKDFSYTWNVTSTKKSKTLYAKGEINKRTVRLHRYITDAPQGYDVDHINGDGLDNRKSNLRVLTHQENLQNRGPKHNNTAGYRGVSWNKALEKWQAFIVMDRKKKHLGYFIDVHEAGRVAAEARAELMPYSKEGDARCIL